MLAAVPGFSCAEEATPGGGRDSVIVDSTEGPSEGGAIDASSASGDSSMGSGAGDAAAVPIAAVVDEGSVGQGSTVYERLVAHGLDAGEAQRVTDALSGLFDFRGSLPEHTYRIERASEGGGVVRFEYRVGPTEVYEVVRNASGALEGRRVPVHTDTRRVRVGGTVEVSLASAIAGVGLRPSVLSVFLGTFDSEVNFLTDQRDGDTFRVVADEEVLDGQALGYAAIWALEYEGEKAGRQRAFFFQSADGRQGFYDAEGQSMQRSMLRTPLNYVRISSHFNPRRMHPVLHRHMAHKGVDFAAPRGTPVWATAAGEIAYVGRKGAAGNLVIIRHDDGLESMYGHLERFARGVKQGVRVEQRQVIGSVGSTGRSTGPHLHFGLRKGGQFIDPLKFRAAPGRPIEARYRAQFLKHARALAGELDSIQVR